MWSQRILGRGECQVSIGGEVLVVLQPLGRFRRRWQREMRRSRFFEVYCADGRRLWLNPRQITMAYGQLSAQPQRAPHGWLSLLKSRFYTR